MERRETYSGAAGIAAEPPGAIPCAPAGGADATHIGTGADLLRIAIGAGADPAVFALTVALATSNSFLIPTHQVNALIMGPAGYRVPDFIRAGGIMTILFLVVLIVMMNVVF